MDMKEGDLLTSQIGDALTAGFPAGADKYACGVGRASYLIYCLVYGNESRKTFAVEYVQKLVNEQQKGEQREQQQL